MLVDRVELDGDECISPWAVFGCLIKPEAIHPSRRPQRLRELRSFAANAEGEAKMRFEEQIEEAQAAWRAHPEQHPPVPKRFAIEDYKPGEIVTFTPERARVDLEFPMGLLVYPTTAIVTPAPGGGSGGDWVGTDENGYVSARLKARIMPVGDGKWWAQLGDGWISQYDGIVEYPTARMAREQVERRREAERAG